MALQQIRISATITAVQEPAAPGDGGTLQELVWSFLLADGVGDFQADRVAKKTYTVAGSGSQSVDLTTLTDAYGTAISAAEVVAIGVHNHAFLSDGTTASGGVLNVSPNASNGWTGLLADASDILKVPAGAITFNAASRTGYAVTASNKVLDLDNANSGSVYVTIIVLARSS